MIQRYNFHRYGMEYDSKNGRYVEYSEYQKLLSLCEKLYATRGCDDCSAWKEEGCEGCEAENAYDDYKKFKEENE